MLRRLRRMEPFGLAVQADFRHSRRTSVTRPIMEPKTEKMALFIDGANLYATAKSLGFDIELEHAPEKVQPFG